MPGETLEKGEDDGSRKYVKYVAVFKVFIYTTGYTTELSYTTGYC